MTKPRTLWFIAFTVSIISILLAGSYGSAAPTQMGHSYSINAIINELSSPDDQKVLLEAFQTKGNEGLVNTLSKMPSKGRLAITGTLGGDLAYIRRFDQPDGTVMIRMITNRLLRFGEVWADTRSSDYQLTGLEIIFSKDKRKTKAP